jgi:hypothetical protein
MRIVSVILFVTASAWLASNCANADWIIHPEDFDGLNDANGYVSTDAEFDNERERSPLEDGRTRTFAWAGIRGGTLNLDDGYGNNTSSLNEAIFTVTLLGYTDITRHSDDYDFFDEVQGIGTSPLVNHIFFAGVSVSSDGTSGYPLINFSQKDFTWETDRASISDLFDAVPVPHLSEAFPIKLQQYDHDFHGLDGRRLDNVVVESAQQPHLPEPEAVTLFGLGLLCLGMSCVRRRTMG